MTPFFQSSEQLSALDREARSWVGTPFVPHAMVKNAGADCVHLVAGIYLACGALHPPLNLPKYSMDEGAHLKKSKISEWFASRPEFTLVTDIEIGDTVIIKMSRVGHHVGLILSDGDMIQAFPERKVTLSNLRESFYRRAITEIYRPIVIRHSSFVIGKEGAT